MKTKTKNQKRKNKKYTPKSKQSEIPSLTVVGIKDLEDGTAELTFDINDAYIEIIKTDLKKEKVSKEEINAWILNMLEKCIKGAEEVVK
jgi:hypothetical protein